jgi:HSP20 family protein
MLALAPLRKSETVSDVPSRSRWFDHFLEEKSPFGSARCDKLTPDFDLSETEENLILKADIAGMDTEDLDISIVDNVLVVEGRRKEEREEENECFYSKERQFGSFSRSFSLPDDVQTDGIEATYKDGVLKLIIPKTGAAKPKKIEIKTH